MAIASNFPVRRQNFVFTNLTKHWFADNKVLTSFWNALSITFPEGERFFVRSVKPFQNEVRYPDLQNDIKNFIGQEAQHGKEHHKLNGLFRTQTEVELEQLVTKILKTAENHLPLSFRLAATCALEHFTALLAEELILEKRNQELFHHAVKDLWLWHAVEESEHKHVAYNVFQEKYGNYLTRIAIMVIVSAILASIVLYFQYRILKDEKELPTKEEWIRSFKYFFIEEKLFTNMLPAYLSYFFIDFHPNKNNTLVLLSERDKIIKQINAKG